MSLRAKTFTAIAATLAVLMAVLFYASSEIVQGGFAKVERTSLDGFAAIEEKDALRNVERVSDALAFRVETLATKAADWAQWDDTYRFVQDRNKAFADSNLGEEALTALKINLLLIVDPRGNVVYGFSYDLDKDRETPLPASLLPHLSPGGVLLRHNAPDDVTQGLLSLPEGPLMVASRPIVKSNGEGPARGAVIFGRYLDEAEFRQLADVTHLSIVHFYGGFQTIPEDFRQILSRLTPDKPILVEPRDQDVISGYTSIRDLTGNPTLHLRVDITRDIHRQGTATGQAIRERGEVIRTSLILSILLVGLILCLVIGVLIERWVLSRLARVSKKAVEIGTRSDFSARVSTEGEDEISRLARSLNKMLDSLEESHHAIERRNAEMRLLMDTVPTGLISLDEQFRINPETSRSAQEMLADDRLPGKRFVEALGLVGEREKEAKSLEDFWDVLRQELVDAESMAGLNPFEEFYLERPGTLRWIRLRYYVIRRGKGQRNHILTVIEDITEAKRLAARIATSERENLQLKAIAEDPELFREFLSESAAILRTVREKVHSLTPGEESRPLIHEIFRGVHTIKGVSGSFGLAQLSELAGELESSLEKMRSPGETITGDKIAETDKRLAQLDACFQEAKASARRILGDDVDAEGGVFLRIGSGEINRHIEEVRDLSVSEKERDAAMRAVKAECVRRLAELRAVPARRGLARAIKIIPGLIARLGKAAKFTFKGADTPIDCDVARELNTPLIHMIRNALDHGIEDMETRLETGKSEEGEVTLRVVRDTQGLVLSLHDDGKGLDPAALRASAVRKGLLTEAQAAALTDAETRELIFRPGFSTAGEVTDVSGRGVGMDAVLQSVRENLHGSVQIHSEQGRGTTFRIEIPQGEGSVS